MSTTLRGVVGGKDIGAPPRQKFHGNPGRGRSEGTDRTGEGMVGHYHTSGVMGDLESRLPTKIHLPLSVPKFPFGSRNSGFRFLTTYLLSCVSSVSIPLGK